MDRGPVPEEEEADAINPAAATAAAGGDPEKAPEPGRRSKSQAGSLFLPDSAAVSVQQKPEAIDQVRLIVRRDGYYAIEDV